MTSRSTWSPNSTATGRRSGETYPSLYDFHISTTLHSRVLFPVARFHATVCTPAWRRGSPIPMSRSKNSYVPVSPGRIEERKALGPASYLHEFLVDHQTDAEGNVNYGKPFGYAWIRARWDQAPPLRTMKRHMARLKSAGRVWVQQQPWGEGMRVRLLGSAKWPSQPAQMALFPAPEILSITSGKAVRKLSNSKSLMGPKVAPSWGQKWPRNEVKKQREEKNYGEPLAVARSSPVEEAAALDERRRLLADQARMLQAKFKGSG